MGDAPVAGSKRLAAEGNVPNRQATRSPSPARVASRAESSGGMHAVSPESAQREQPTMADIKAPDLTSNAAVRGEVAPIMDACCAQVELVRCGLADGQRQNHAIRAEAAHATEYLNGAVFLLVARGVVHRKCTRRLKTATRSALIGWTLRLLPQSRRP